MNRHDRRDARITTACILAAGTGSRLQPLTECMPKCLTEVHGRSILERLVSCLRAQGFKRLVFVVGHLEDCIRSFLELHAADLTIDYVSNPLLPTEESRTDLSISVGRPGIAHSQTILSAKSQPAAHLALTTSEIH